MSRGLSKVWRLLRRLADDDAYDRYLQHHARQHRDEVPLDRRAFYLAQQRRKWSGVQRCC